MQQKPPCPRRASAPLFERLEDRRLMSFVPIITLTALTANNASFGIANVDANLVNPWGVALLPDGHFAIANEATSTSTTLDSSGAAQPSAASETVVSIPAATGAAQSNPTGIVAHTGGGFVVSSGGKSAPATLLFATVSGTIAAYTPAVSTTHAFTVVDHSSSGDIYTGLATLGTGASARIYAADFRNGIIDEFNSKFQQIPLRRGAFFDSTVPAGYAPFGIQALKGKLYITYARQNASATADNPGPARGIIDTYSAAGKYQSRIAVGGDLNSPWGLAIAPSSWGVFKGDLLAANDGDGTIDIFNKKHNTFIEQIPDPNSATGQPYTIQGLWGITAGKGKDSQKIFFVSAPSSHSNGIFGVLTATK